MKHVGIIVATLGLFAASAASATSGATTYSSAADFAAATHGVTTNGFENAPTNSSVWILQSGSYAQPGFTITATNNNAFNSDATSNPSTDYYYNWGTGDVINTPYDGTMTITFSAPVTAFALDLGTFYGLPFPYPAGVTPGAATTRYGVPVTIGTSQGDFTVATNSTQTLAFFGATSTTGFTSFTIRGLSGQTGASTVIDNLRFGSIGAAAAVPEPATWAMMLAGFGMVGFGLRRRGAVNTTVAHA